MAATQDIFYLAMLMHRYVNMCLHKVCVDSQMGKEVYQKQSIRELQAKSVVKKRSSFI